MPYACPTAIDPRQLLGAERPVRWPLGEELESSPMVAYRNQFAEYLAGRDVDEILDAYIYCTVSEMDQLVRLVETHALPRPLEGLGLELGAGTALLSCVVAKRFRVEAILALEICQQMAALVMPKVSRAILGEESDRILPVVGSFDDLRLPDESLDFVIDIDSLHHSDDLPRTVAESSRVLKHGGTMLVLDRCHPNELTDSDVQRMLSVEYSREFLERNHYPTDIVLTRRDNGEHEYRQREWQAAFQFAGLTLERMIEFQRPLTLSHAIKGLCSPWSKRPVDGRVTRNGYCLGTAWDYAREKAAQWLGTESPTDYVLAPKRTTVFTLSKQC